MRAEHVDRFELVAESLRRLAWGPDGEDLGTAKLAAGRPAKRKAEPEREFSGWEGVWRRIE